LTSDIRGKPEKVKGCFCVSRVLFCIKKQAQFGLMAESKFLIEMAAPYRMGGWTEAKFRLK